MIYYISLGSNIGDRLDNISKALKLIQTKAIILKKSNFYITKPMYFNAQPYFINSVIKIDSQLNPFELLSFLNQIEIKLKRKRIFKNSPRTIDLDILYYEKNIINGKNLIIPHPRIYERAFVLKPFLDIDPDFIDPIKNKKICEIFKSLKYNHSDVIEMPQNFNDIFSFFSLLPLRRKEEFKSCLIKGVLEILGNPEKKCGKIIHITGSVGKTTTSKYIYDMIRSTGFNVALYTSPHIKDVRERIIFNDKKIEKKDFYNNLIYIISNSKVILSPFEYLTLIAIIYFSSKKPKYSIFEVGMGGRDDATNVFDKSISVFTKITLEHQRYLGRSLLEIVKNKSGIIKENGKVFISGQNTKKVINAITHVAQRKKSKVYIFDISNKIKDFDIINLNFAKFVISKIGIKIKKKVKFKNFDCRKQILKYGNIKILFDGAHTPFSLKMFIKGVNYLNYSLVLCSFMRDKKVKKMLDIIKDHGFKIFLSKSYHPRSFNPFKYQRYGLCFKDPKSALNKVLKYKKNFIVTGSLYFCSDVLKLLKNKKINYFRELI